MTSFKTTFLILSLASCCLAFGKPMSSKTLQDRAATFLLKKAQGQLQIQSLRSQSLTRDFQQCHQPLSTECIQFVAGNFPSDDERAAAARACVGNEDATCAKFVAGNYPTTDERVNAAKACRNNLGSACAEFVAGNYPTEDERINAAKACENADVECVKYTAGNYPTSDERLNAAKACGGN
jgi:hypothetical protein